MIITVGSWQNLGSLIFFSVFFFAPSYFASLLLFLGGLLVFQKTRRIIKSLHDGGWIPYLGQCIQRQGIRYNSPQTLITTGKAKREFHSGRGGKSGKVGGLLWMAVCQRPSPSRNLHPAIVRGRLRTLPSTEGRRRCNGQWKRRTRHSHRGRSHQTGYTAAPAYEQIPQTHRPASESFPDKVRQLYSDREPSPQRIRPRLLPQS